MGRSPDRRLAWVAIATLGLLFLVVLLRTAWLCDDAYIVLRSVDNLLHGHGLRWNVAERVQTFTNPLWTLLLSSVILVTSEFYYTALFLGIAVSIAAVLVSVRVARTPAMAALALACLAGSKSFVDFSTSGLENPLTHLLLGVFFVLYLRRDRTPRALFWLSLLAALAMVNRVDIALIYLPALGYAFWETRSRRTLASFVLGSLPFVLWEAFSLVYYGFLVPNTAHAKLDHGIGAAEILVQGLHYFGSSVGWDPLTPAVVVVGCAIPIVMRARALLPIVAGVLLYLVYVASIGGDFMAGRFFTAPMYVSVLLLSRFNLISGRLSAIAAFVAVFGLSALAPHPPWATGAGFGTERSHWKDEQGIVDERQIFFRATGLFRTREGGSDPSHRWARQGKALRADPPDSGVGMYGAVGLRGFYAGPEVHLVDPFGLGDPLLSRMPSIHNPNWRIAHFQRVVPPGYLQGVRTGENRLADPLLARYYDKILLITRAPLFGAERWKAIWGMHLGSYDSWIDRQAYRFPRNFPRDEPPE